MQRASRAAAAGHGQMQHHVFGQCQHSAIPARSHLPWQPALLTHLFIPGQCLGRQKMALGAAILSGQTMMHIPTGMNECRCRAHTATRQLRPLQPVPAEQCSSSRAQPALRAGRVLEQCVQLPRRPEPSGKAAAPVPSASSAAPLSTADGQQQLRLKTRLIAELRAHKRQLAGESCACS